MQTLGLSDVGIRAVIETFKDTPVFKKAIREEEEKHRAERQTHVRAIASARGRLEREAPALIAGRTAAEKKVAEARAAVVEAENGFRIAHAAVQNLDAVVQREIEKHECALRASAPPEIDAFKDELESLLQKTGIMSPTRTEEWTGRLDASGNRQMRRASNIDSIKGRLRALREAKQKAEDLKTAAPSNLAAAIEEIRAGIPEVESPRLEAQ